ncbi:MULTISPECIES: VOC family protein [unclassified Frankia]|uniref:VOC family protein n=1 Tax=unclassified Frankia TaxID=2632575 RepID=UPI001EF6313B|nr:MULTISPECIES: hypothetical protein [unclassified Frankia]
MLYRKSFPSVTIQIRYVYNAEMTETQINLIVLYCSDVSACREFYRTLGLVFERERHGSGPEHYAATLAGGAVLELYPAGGREVTGRIRIGLTIYHSDFDLPLEPGNHVLRDPEGRTIDIHVAERTEPAIMIYTALATSIIGKDVAATVESFPSGAVVIDIRVDGHHASIAGKPGDAEWGVSVDPLQEQGFTGHEKVVSSAEEALAVIRDVLRTADAGQ